MCDLGFINQIEGLLGDGDYLPEVFIILREPHQEDSKDKQIFWFKGEMEARQGKEVTMQEVNPTGTRFYNIFTTLARKILNTKDECVLSKCAFMNLHPFFGEEKTGTEYKKILMTFKKLSLADSLKDIVNIGENRDISEYEKEIAKHRTRIIQNAIDNGVKNIITTEDIYCAIKKKWGVKDQETFSMKYNFKNDKENPKSKDFHVCYLGENKQTRLISFWHPSCRYIDYNYVDEIKIP